MGEFGKPKPGKSWPGGVRSSLGSILEKYDKKSIPDDIEADVKFDIKSNRPTSIEMLFQKREEDHFDLARDEIFDDEI